MSDNPLIKLGDLTKPATVLIEKISEAVGGVFKPWQIVRVAKAEAVADQLRAESHIQISELQQRALRRFLVEEGKKQSNIEDITEKALPLLSEESKPQDIEDDWITNFFDKSRIISDSEMQQLWSRVLASEANAPGSFSRRTVNLISDLEKRDAELFAALCGFAWMIGSVTPLVFEAYDALYERHGLNFDQFRHLESLGLIQLEYLGAFTKLRMPKKITVSYFGRFVELTLPNERDNRLITGRVLLTQAGQELARVCGAKHVDGFFETIFKQWEDQSFMPNIVTPPAT